MKGIDDVRNMFTNKCIANGSFIGRLLVKVDNSARYEMIHC